MVRYLALNCWAKFQKNLTAFRGVMTKKHLQAAKNCPICCYENIWHLKTRELHIRHKMKLIYMIQAYICTSPNTFRLPKIEAVNQGGGRREDILKLLLKVWLNFVRSFRDLLHTNPQNTWPRWLLACFLIITSPFTSSYSFSLSFFGHWYSFTCNRRTKSLLPYQKLARMGLWIPFSVA